MKIEFEKIIELANKRKEALENFSNMMENFNEFVDAVDSVETFLKDISVAFYSLDAEGRAMLGPQMNQQLNQWCGSYGHVAVMNKAIGHMREFVTVVESVS